MQNAMHTVRILRNTILDRRYSIMSFQIKPDKKETENKTIRFPLPLIHEIEQAIRGKNTTFSGFVIQACQYAWENIKTDKT